MRAARYGHYANELLGIVLSMREIENSLGDSEFPTGWYFLDYRSFAIVNLIMASFGPIIACILVGWLQRDWRFIALGMAYAGFVSVMWWILL